ncbi:MAG: tetratricopeptide repeat protein, partial [Betaproteobacteria bacterium]|nr:tetratricopeptide repeat protein [Betaproteobacteria bacterium]
MRNLAPKGVVLALLGCAVLAGCGRGMSEAAHLKRGEAFYARHQYGKARVEFENVLQIDPKSVAGFYYSGRVAQAEQDWPLAFADYRKAVELDPGDIKAEVRLGELYLFAGDSAHAARLAKAVLRARPADPAGHTLDAAVAVRQGNAAAAIRELAQVVGQDPAESDAVVLLANSMGEAHDTSRAEAVLAMGIKASPRDAALREDYALVAGSAGQWAQAEQAYRAAIAIAPKELPYRAALAAFYARTAHPARAEATLRQAIAQTPDDPQPYLLLTSFLGAREGLPAAARMLAGVADTHPKVYELSFALASLYQQMGRPDEAQAALQRVIHADGDGPAGLKASTLLAGLENAQGKRAQADKLLKAVLAHDAGNVDALLLQGEMRLAHDDALDAVDDFRSVLKEEPNSPEVLLLLAKAHLANGDPQLAQAVFTNALAAYPDDAAIRIAMADFLEATKHYRGALAQLNAVLKNEPDNLGVFQKKTALLVGEKDFDAAERALVGWRNAHPAAYVGNYQLGIFYAQRQEPDRALSAFALALQQDPGAFPPLAALTRILLAQGHARQAIARVAQAIRVVPKSARHYELIGMLEMADKQFAASQAALRHAMALSPRTPAPYQALAQLDAGEGRMTDAIAILEQGLRVQPDNPALSMSLAQAYGAAGQSAQAIRAYEGILRRFPGDQLAANNLASLLTRAKGDPASLRQALALAAPFQNSGNAGFVDTLGWVYVKMGQYGRAIALLQRSVAAAPKIPVFQYHL